jgi:hypothetical protein
MMWIRFDDLSIEGIMEKKTNGEVLFGTENILKFRQDSDKKLPSLNLSKIADVYIKWNPFSTNGCGFPLEEDLTAFKLEEDNVIAVKVNK